MEGLTQDERYLYLVLEYIPGGELFTYLRGVGRLESSHAAYFIQYFQNSYCLKVLCCSNNSYI